MVGAEGPPLVGGYNPEQRDPRRGEAPKQSKKLKPKLNLLDLG